MTIAAKKSLRIAIFGEKFPPHGGGIATAHFNLGRLLSRHHQTRLFAFVDEECQSDSTVCRGRGNRIVGFVLEKALGAYVRRYDRSGQIDCCRKIARTLASVRSMNSALARFRPHIVVLSDDRLPALGLRRPPGAKLLWVAHHNYARFMNQAFLPVSCNYDYFLAHRLERRALRKCDFAVFPSRYMEQVFRDTLSSTMPGAVIPNYFDLTQIEQLNRTEIRRKLLIEDREILVFIPSGGTDVKGARFVPEIIRRISRVSKHIGFIVTGPINCQLHPELELLKSSHRILRPGPVSHEVNLEYAAACDLAVSPALLENYSCALLECSAIGLPVVTFNVGGNSEIVEDGATGYVVPTVDIDSLCDRSADLITNATKRMYFSEAAKKRASHLSNGDAIAAQYDQLFAQCFPVVSVPSNTERLVNV
ncbi:MAG: glycosyltransferase family 4 protein [Planctomycetales bacterium]|nr:glycosyltransferase family 4 protein [Planctomycetales bacterium]